MQPEQQQRIMGYFIEEAKDHLNTIEQGLLNLQSTIEDAEMVNELFRAAHSVKGGAAMLGLNSIQQVSHRLEDFFKILKESRVRVDQNLESLLLKVFDALQELLEQLQGPFGLTDEMANTTLSGVQPTFDELERHLEILVSEAEPITSMPTTGFLSGNDLVTASSLDATLAQTFGTEVPVRLREMLQLFKQPDADVSGRYQLEAICRELVSMGELFDLSAWCGLVETARRAIAESNNSYRTLAPVVIRDIKQAQDLVLAGRADEITPCAQLLEMAPTLAPVEVAADSDFADLLAAADNADLGFDLSDSSESFDEESLFDGLDLTPDTHLNLSSSDLDFGDVFGEEPLSMEAIGQQGPEVGMAELNSLADLFEGEVPDLGSTWQEEEIIGDGDVLTSGSANIASDMDESVDFSDLLFDESETAPTIIQSKDDDLSDLFGDELLEEEESFVESEATGFPSIAPSSSNELEDLLTISESDDLFGAEEMSAIASPADEQDPFAGLDLDEGLGLENFSDGELGVEPDGESDAALGDLGELFAGMDETDLNLSGLESSSGEFFSATESGDDENLFAAISDEPSGVATPVEDGVVVDPWEDPFAESAPTSSELLSEFDLSTTFESTPGESTEDAFSDMFGSNDLLNDDSLLDESSPDELIEELSDQDESDFSGLFETSTASGQEISEDAAIEELIDDSLDFSSDSWLSDISDTSRVASPSDAEPLELPADDSGTNPFADLDTGLESIGFSEASDIDFFAESTPADGASASMEGLEGFEDVLSPEASATASGEGELNLDLSELGLDELDFGGSDSATSTSADDGSLDFGEFDLPTEAFGESVLQAEDNLGLDLEDLGSLDLSPVEGEESSLESVSDQDMADLLGAMDLQPPDLGASTPEAFPLETSTSDLWEDLPDTADLDLDFGDDTLSTEALITEPLTPGETDLFAEDLAAVVGADATIAQEGEFPVEANFDDDLLELESLGMTDVPEISELSETELSETDLSLDLESSGFEDIGVPASSLSSSDAIDFGNLDFPVETASETTDLGDFGDLGDLLGEEMPATSDAVENLNRLLGESSTAEPFTDFGDLGDLLGEETASVSGELGDLDRLLGESSTPETSDFSDLGDLLGASSAAETPTDFGDLGDLLGEETISASGESGDLDSLLEESSTPATSTDFGALGDLLNEETTSASGESGDVDSLLEEFSTPETSVFDDLGDFLGEETAPASSELGDLDSLLGESSTPETSDFGDLGDWLGESAAEESSSDFGDLGDLLGEEATPETDAFDDLDFLGEIPTSDTASEFEDLDSLLGEEDSLAVDDNFADLENSVGEDTPESSSFADLEDLLDEGSLPLSPISSFGDVSSQLDAGSQNFAEIEGFADLEALLEADEPASSPTQLTEPSTDSDFDELDDLLKEAEEKMGGSPSVPASRGLGTQNRRLSRPSRVFSEQTMRVPVKHLDNLSNLVGELVVNRNSLEQDQERLRQSLDNLLYQVQQLSDVGQRMQDLYERSLLESSLLASRQNYRQGSSSVFRDNRDNTEASTQRTSTSVEYDPLEMDRFTGFHSLSQEMIELIVRVRESASDIEFIVDETDQVTRMFRQVTTQLQEGLTRSRMVPFAQTADRMPRAVRDISMRVGKQAELVIEGRETLIDKMILEQLYDPMTHLVNNAITHGIESPDVRRAAGKPAAGRITIRAFHQGNQTIISVSDDGAGIDVERVKAKAIEKGLITPAEARSMSRLDVYDLLFHAGFSTKDQADDFAGRGVGMDVVRTSLSEIRGAINTDSTAGKGTTFTIRLPLTLSISKALCCISDRARIAFPMDGVEDMLDVPKERIQTNAEGQPCLPWRDSLLPLRPLVDLLAYNRHLSRGNVYGGNQEDDISSIVVLRSAGNFLALQVDQVLGEQEIVIKQLEGPVPKPVGVAGATVLGDGRIMPIADVLELIDLAMGRIRKDAGGSLWDQGGATVALEPQVTKTEPMVLIVDDSITVRELLSMTFNKVGYRVEQARDGQEAWEKLRSGLPCDIVFCDIEMPRMDGLELLSRIQKDPNLTHMPIAMLTSRGADRHRQMASSLGASGYFTKPYLEEALLDAAQRMLKGERLL